jgi:pimeloyl-ACP methyl ester carboxylesterase
MKFSIETVKIKGIAIECFLPEHETAKAPLLFVHGSTCGSWVWENFLGYFASRGWACYAPNLRGHNVSEPVEDWGTVGVSSYLEDIDTAVTWLGRAPVLIGHSMGGVLSQKYAETGALEKMILLHTAPPKSVIEKIDFNAFMKRGQEQGRVMTEKTLQPDKDPQKLIGYMFDPGNVEPEVLQMCHRRMCPESTRALFEMKDVDVDAQRVKCPVYVIGFDLKKIGLDYPIDLGRELARYYGARDYQVIEPGGHMFMLEKNWEEFARLIERWLKE